MVCFICSGISAAGSVLQTSSCLFVVRRCYHPASLILNKQAEKSAFYSGLPTRGISLSINVVFKAILGKMVSNKVTSENNIDLIYFNEVMHIHTKRLQKALLSQILHIYITIM